MSHVASLSASPDPSYRDWEPYVRVQLLRVQTPVWQRVSLLVPSTSFGRLSLLGGS